MKQSRGAHCIAQATQAWSPEITCRVMASPGHRTSPREVALLLGFRGRSPTIRAHVQVVGGRHQNTRDIGQLAVAAEARLTVAQCPGRLLADLALRPSLVGAVHG